jgi:subtilisin-like proprotein convertase family protein
MKFTFIHCGLAALFVAGLSSAHAAPVTFSATDIPVVIADQGTVTSTIHVTSPGNVIDVDTLLNITHSYDNDLVLTLSHGATTVLLSYRNGGSGGADYADTLFDDSAALAINAGYAYAPYTGSFRPQEPLSAFLGQQVAGDWILTATDMEAGDSGVINNWSLVADFTPAAAVPEPASLALFIFGMMGLARSRRRK